MFMGFAVAVVCGGILVFVPLAITFALFNGSLGVKIFDFLLLVGIIVVGLRMSLRSFRPRICWWDFSGFAYSGWKLLSFVVSCFGLLYYFALSATAGLRFNNSARISRAM